MNKRNFILLFFSGMSILSFSFKITDKNNNQIIDLKRFEMQDSIVTNSKKDTIPERFGMGNEAEKALTIEQINQQSEDYKIALEIREQVLRVPFGLTFTEEELASDSLGIHFVIKDAGKLAGTVVLKAKGNTICTIDQIAITPSYTGQNITGFLLRYCEGYARTNKFQKLSFDIKTSSLTFYENLGYLPVEEEFYKFGMVYQRVEKVL